jgi:hypothetical protein
MPDNDAQADSDSNTPHLDIRQLQKLSYSKRLNFLLGAGASQPAIPTLKPNQKPEDLIARIRDTSCNLAGKGNLNNKAQETLDAYSEFLTMIISVLGMSNSRIAPRSANIFTTNYDLFVEAAIDKIMRNNYNVIFNDGANGYFKRYLNTFNYDRSTAFRGQFENYNHETPAIRLIKPHGSINWEKSHNEEDSELIEVFKEPAEKDPFIVPPDKYESGHTMESRHFFEMLRLFNIELDKPQSILFVIGFSFQDRHIKGMVQRALQNPGLLVCVFAYSDETSGPDDGNARETIIQNLERISSPNLVILSPKDVTDFVKNLSKKTGSRESTTGRKSESETIRLDLRTVTRLLMPSSLNNPSTQIDSKGRDK